MTTSMRLAGLGIAMAMVMVGAAGTGCSNGGTMDGSGGAVSSGGKGGGGGKGSGGSAGSGGSVGSGGTLGTGGVAKTGGAGGRGGKSGSGGSAGSGGGGVGGKSGSGGNAGSGGSAGSGGTGGTTQRMKVGANFWFLWAESTGDPFRQGVNFATETNPWKSEVLDELQGYAALRFMDWNVTNWSPEKDWSTRRQKTESPQQADADGQNDAGDLTPGHRGVAYEWMIDLCNRVGADPWITLPHLTIETYEANASDNYFVSLANLAKQLLDPARNIYLEYSNETWNGGFSQSQYCDSRAGTGGTSNGDDFHVYAAMRIFKVFNDVFGSDSSRVKKVLGGNLYGTNRTTTMVKALKNTTINPWGITPDYLAVANYIGCDGMDGKDVDQTLKTKWEACMVEHADYMEQHKSKLAGTGIKLIAYEGGTDMSNAGAIRTKAIGYDLYKEMLQEWSKHLDVWMQYTHQADNWNQWGWGIKKYFGQPCTMQESPTCRAVFDWITNVY